MKSARKTNTASNVINFPTQKEPNSILIPQMSNFRRTDDIGYHNISYNKYHFMAGDKIIVKHNFLEDELMPDSFVIADNKITIFSLVENKNLITGLVTAFIREV